MVTPTTSTPDPVLETRIFWDRYKREIAAVIGIALLAAIGFSTYRYYEQRRENEAAAAVASAKTPEDYRRAIANYPKSPALATAYLSAADALRNAKDYAGANAELQQFVDKFASHSMATTARMAIASNLEAMGKNDEALATYQKIAASYPRDFLAPLAMISEVHLFEAKGQHDDARKACEDVMSQHSDSYFAAEAGAMLRRLKPAAGATAKVEPSVPVPPPQPNPAGPPAKP